MSAQFKVGEIAITHGLDLSPAYNLRECVIIEGLHECGVVKDFGFDRLLPSVPTYFVAFSDGQQFEVEPRNLRKKEPPKDDEAAAHHAMLDCIERARLPQGVPA